jgi:hypothetical protein
MLSSYQSPLTTNKSLVGAWQFTDGSMLMTKIYSDKYFSVAIYNLTDKTFTGTAGGAWRIEGNTIVETFEFSSLQPNIVGTEIQTSFSIDDKSLTMKTKSKEENWKRLDNGTPGKLAGAWLITGRMENGEIKWRTPGVRKTMKILSGTRFQWIAYNTETKEFFGTGGGTYTTQDGKYTENIEFFSRDNSRVGASLQFDFSMEDGNWRHKGLSSKGDPIDEVWSRREVIEK